MNGRVVYETLRTKPDGWVWKNTENRSGLGDKFGRYL